LQRLPAHREPRAGPVRPVDLASVDLASPTPLPALHSDVAVGVRPHRSLSSQSEAPRPWRPRSITYRLWVRPSFRLSHHAWASASVANVGRRSPPLCTPSNVTLTLLDRLLLRCAMHTP